MEAGSGNIVSINAARPWVAGWFSFFSCGTLHVLCDAPGEAP